MMERGFSALPEFGGEFFYAFYLFYSVFGFIIPLISFSLIFKRFLRCQYACFCVFPFLAFLFSTSYFSKFPSIPQNSLLILRLLANSYDIL